MRLLSLPVLLSLSAYTSALPKEKPLPLLIWHGLGDRFDAEGLHAVGALAAQIHPGTYVYYIHTAADGGADRTNSFLGNVSMQIEGVCEALQNDPGLNAFRADTSPLLRVDALGFSQGGQFLRGLQERCAHLSIRSLVTFGSQHNGITQFQNCSAWDFVCKSASALMRGNVWTDTVQGGVVPAQYFRPSSLNASTGEVDKEYAAHSHFLADINNERTQQRNEKYAERIAALEKFVMYVFDDDTTVLPKESGWFAEVNSSSGIVTPLRERRIYKEDWLGLKTLDEKGGLVFRSTPGRHMALDEGVLKEAFREFFGPERQKGKGWWRSWWEGVTKQHPHVGL